VPADALRRRWRCAVLRKTACFPRYQHSSIAVTAGYLVHLTNRQAIRALKSGDLPVLRAGSADKQAGHGVSKDTFVDTARRYAVTSCRT